jgi:hypothetical protein
LPEALHRMLGSENFVVIYDDTRRPRMIDLLADRPDVFSPAPPASPDVASRLIARHPDVRLGADLARALGAWELPIQQLLERGFRHEAKEIRSEAVRTAIETLESDAELRDAVLGALPGLTDATLVELVRGVANGHDEEMLFYLATQTRATELRNRAVGLLQQIQARTFGPTHAGS